MKNDIEGREESFLAGQIKKNNLGKDLVFSRLKKRWYPDKQNEQKKHTIVLLQSRVKFWKKT